MRAFSRLVLTLILSVFARKTDPQPQNEYIEEAVRRHGRRLDHEERTDVDGHEPVARRKKGKRTRRNKRFRA